MFEEHISVPLAESLPLALNLVLAARPGSRPPPAMSGLCAPTCAVSLPGLFSSWFRSSVCASVWLRALVSCILSAMVSDGQFVSIGLHLPNFYSCVIPSVMSPFKWFCHIWICCIAPLRVGNALLFPGSCFDSDWLLFPSSASLPFRWGFQSVYIYLKDLLARRGTLWSPCLFRAVLQVFSSLSFSSFTTWWLSVVVCLDSSLSVLYLLLILISDTVRLRWNSWESWQLMHLAYYLHMIMYSQISAQLKN